MTLSGTLSTPQGMSGMLSLSAGTDPTLSREGVAADAKAVGELKADIIEDTVSGPIANMTDAKAGAVNSLEVAITPKQAGTGDPSPTNVRAISGWTGANVYATGKNIWDEQWELGGLSGTNGQPIDKSDRFRSKNYSPCLPSTTYFAVNDLLSAGLYLYVWYYDSTYTFISSVGKNGASFTTPANAYYFKISTYGGPVSYTRGISINYPATDTAYHAYVGSTYPVSFGAAGTVYGGRLNVTTGELTVTHGYIGSYAGETLPGKWICDKAVYVAGTTPPTGAQVVYELATPTTYQLTPVEVTTLLGENNIWADCGDVEVEYKCDTKLYIQKLTIPTEDDMTANQNIASGKFFMIGNSLYYSTASIANGAKIIVGTNCNRVSIADALNNINS